MNRAELLEMPPAQRRQRWLLLLVALAIKLDSSGPVFFRQPREGFNNKSFRVFKFRTMYNNLGEVDNIQQASRKDPRVTMQTYVIGGGIHPHHARRDRLAFFVGFQ